MSEREFTTVAELIEELKQFPPDLTICGYKYGDYSSKPVLYEDKLRIVGGELEYYSGCFDDAGEVVEALFIDFKPQ